MPLLVLVLLLGLIALELWVMVLVASVIGVGFTVLAVIAISCIGAWLMRREGARTLRVLQQSLQLRRSPSRQIGDGALIVLGGVLMVIPGFVSGAFGLLFLLPPTRAVLRWSAGAVLGRQVARRIGRPDVITVPSDRADRPHGKVIDGEIE
ncbi:MAG TPA: FxsA family protein [Mycobacteriales bacterium]|nr:FxsA family protein [Mycobacteriales bacterium]